MPLCASRTNVAELSGQELEQWRDIVEQMQVAADLFNSIVEHPLREIETSNYLQTLKTELRDLLTQQLILLTKFKSSAQSIIQLLGGNQNNLTYAMHNDLSKLCRLLMTNRDIPSPLLKTRNLYDIIKHVRETIPRGIERDKIENEYSKHYSNTFFDIGAQKLHFEWNASQSKWFLPKLLIQNKIAKTLRGFSLSGQIDKTKIPQTLLDIIQYQTEKQFTLKQEIGNPLLVPILAHIGLLRDIQPLSTSSLKASFSSGLNNLEKLL